MCTVLELFFLVLDQSIVVIYIILPMKALSICKMLTFHHSLAGP
jgi:hypothetical protein